MQLVLESPRELPGQRVGEMPRSWPSWLPQHHQQCCEWWPNRQCSQMMHWPSLCGECVITRVWLDAGSLNRVLHTVWGRFGRGWRKLAGTWENAEQLGASQGRAENSWYPGPLPELYVPSAPPLCLLLPWAEGGKEGGLKGRGVPANGFLLGLPSYLAAGEEGSPGAQRHTYHSQSSGSGPRWPAPTVKLLRASGGVATVPLSWLPRGWTGRDEKEAALQQPGRHWEASKELLSASQASPPRGAAAGSECPMSEAGMWHLTRPLSVRLVCPWQYGLEQQRRRLLLLQQELHTGGQSATAGGWRLWESLLSQVMGLAGGLQMGNWPPWSGCLGPFPPPSPPPPPARHWCLFGLLPNWANRNMVMTGSMTWACFPVRFSVDWTGLFGEMKLPCFP